MSARRKIRNGISQPPRTSLAFNLKAITVDFFVLWRSVMRQSRHKSRNEKMASEPRGFYLCYLCGLGRTTDLLYTYISKDASLEPFDPWTVWDFTHLYASQFEVKYFPNFFLAPSFLHLLVTSLVDLLTSSLPQQQQRAHPFRTSGASPIRKPSIKPPPLPCIFCVVLSRFLNTENRVSRCI